MSGRIPAVVLGASGYVGAELMRLTAGHPTLELAAAVSRSFAGERIGDVFRPLAPVYPDRLFETPEEAIGRIGGESRLAVFSAAPHGASAATVADVMDAATGEVHVVDVSADFRYPTASAFEAVYGIPHAAPGLLEQFDCAVPEHLPSAATPHIGHPGCFATAALLAAVPLFLAELVRPEIIVSAVTGSTGSGRSPKPGTHHPDRHGNLYAYQPLTHRHRPEIEALIAKASGRKAELAFVPHSGPFARGIYLTLHARLRGGGAEAVADAYERQYAGSDFVRLVDGMPRLKDVVASNHCHLGVAVDGDRLVVTSAIDNLVKGAAGGAMQWMNRLFDLPESGGLGTVAAAWT